MILKKFSRPPTNLPTSFNEPRIRDLSHLSHLQRSPGTLYTILFPPLQSSTKDRMASPHQYTQCRRHRSTTQNESQLLHNATSMIPYPNKLLAGTVFHPKFGCFFTSLSPSFIALERYYCDQNMHLLILWFSMPHPELCPDLTDRVSARTNFLTNDFQ